MSANYPNDGSLTPSPWKPSESEGPVTGGVNMGNSGGLTRVVSPADLARVEQEARNRNTPATPESQLDALAGYVRTVYEEMKRHRMSAQGWTDRLMMATRMINGEYEPDKLAQIREYEGSEAYPRVVAVKCRGASALLRDIYLGQQRPWGIKATPKPELPEEVVKAVDRLVALETMSAAAQAGVQITPEQQQERRASLLTTAESSARAKADREAIRAQAHLDDILVEGGFYTALGEFLTDLPQMPFAVLKGPEVRMTTALKWERDSQTKRNRPVEVRKPKMIWRRVSPYDLWWTAGAGSPENADFVERQRMPASELTDLMDVPGYEEGAVRRVLEEYQRGFAEPTDQGDIVRAEQESRENPSFNQSGMYDMLEFTGNIRGSVLIDYGWKPPSGEKLDPVRSYSMQVWMVGRFVIKLQFYPNPRRRPPYYITSFEKIPGSMVGNGLPDIIGDIQEVCCATMRALVNNIAIASGPQVAINEEMLAPGEDLSLRPWKTWRLAYDPALARTGQDPIKFFQPDANAAQLLGIYEKFTQMADELSAIPRYITGSGATGGAGRTASGLAMLMNNASKILQTVAMNVDRDVFQHMVQTLYDIVMLTDTDNVLRGDEEIEVKGVNVAIQKETERQRQIEFMQQTNNPTDLKIMGVSGRGKLLRAVSGEIGIVDEIIPPNEVLARMDEQMRAAEQAPPVPTPGDASAAQGSQAGGEETGMAQDTGPRVNLQEQQPAPPAIN